MLMLITQGGIKPVLLLIWNMIILSHPLLWSHVDHRHHSTYTECVESRHLNEKMYSYILYAYVFVVVCQQYTCINL